MSHSAVLAGRTCAVLVLIATLQYTYSLQIVKGTGLHCPGVAGALCGRTCQAYVCGALSQLYKASNNLSDPWDNENGWQLTTTTTCASLMAQLGSPQQAAVYCSWFGVVCCTPAAAAAGNCTIVNAVSGLVLPMNNLNVSLGDSMFVTAIQQLHACGLTVLNLEANNLSGEMDDKQWSKLTNLRVINFANSWIEGSIPAALRKMRNLTRINLSNSYMYGSIPQWIGELQQLEHLNLGTMAGMTDESGLGGTIPGQLGKLRILKELILQSNYLTGTLPPQLCQDNRNLVLINIRANSLEGPAQVLERCDALVQLDISQNSFSGQLPASPLWNMLTTYQASHNNFSGSFPCTLCRHAEMLETLDISHNNVSGPIPNTVTLLSGLKTLNLGSNRLTGTLTENVYYLPGLKVLDISNNDFVGTIPTAIEYQYSLTTADFSNNTGITGILPAQAGFLYNLQRARFTGTSMSCGGIIKPYNITTNASCNDPARCKTPQLIQGEGESPRRCSDMQLLPCFLRFSDDSLPREDASNMRCKYIIRKPPEQARADCAHGAGAYTLEDNAQYLPDIVKDSTEQSWILDPAYYQYSGCSCLQGYNDVWGMNGTILQCVEAPAVDRRTLTAVAAVSAVAGLALLAALLLLGQLYLRTRPRWLRERVMQARRAQGAPKCSKPGDKVRVSIVVTDVKDFSALTGQYHELMMKAMGAHNNILRKACHAHAGYVMDQEGDSWTIAFHDPQDAVAFSLQVQQALSQKVWGVRMPLELHTEHTDSIRYSESSTFGSFTRAKSITQTASQGHNLGSFSSPGQAVLASGASQQSGTEAPGCSGGPLAAVARASQDSALVPCYGSGSALDPTGSTAAAGHTGVAESATQQQQQLGQLEYQVAPRSRSFLQQPNSASFTSSIAHSSVSGPSSASGIESNQQSFTGHSDGVLARIFGKRFSSKTNQDAAAQQHRQVEIPAMHSPADVESPLPTPLQASSDSLPHASGQFATAQTANGKKARFIPRIGSNSSLSQQQHQERDMEYGAAAGGWAFGRSNSSVGSVFDRAGGSFLSGKYDRNVISFTSSGRRRNAAASFMHRFNQFAGKSGNLGDHQPLKLLRLAVRIGVATGPLHYGVALGNTAAKHRAKRLVSEVAAGGQVLCDETTFTSIKDSLSVLGTVNEGGYDNDLLQRLMHAQVIGKLQRQVACAGSPCLRACDQQHQLSFTGGLWGREPQDYDNDAIAVHMGCFDVPNAPVDDLTGSNSSSEGSSPTSGSGELEIVDAGGNSTTAATTSSGPYRCVRQKLHLYSVAAPGMRRWPEDRGGPVVEEQRLGWAELVAAKPDWVQTQKGYFEAPSACQMDLSPGSHLQDNSSQILGEVTVVFVSVAGAASFTTKHNQKDIHAVHKAILKCMLQQINKLPGRDGYLCRCQESDLRYMLAFEKPCKAVQWCLLVQEALLYVAWPAHVLAHQGFEEELCPLTGSPLFRGPRLRMGLAAGHPNSVLPDHNGRANYYGGSVNRAARYMDAAAHGGQVVTDLETGRKVLWEWDRELHGPSEKGSFTAANHSRVPVMQARLGAIDSLRLRAADKLQGVDRVCHSSVASGEGSLTGCSHDKDTNFEDQQQLAPLTYTKQAKQQQLDPMLQLAKRSASETAARSHAFGSRRGLLPLPQHAEGKDPAASSLTVRCKSFTEDMPASTAAAGLLAGSAAAAESVEEVVKVRHIGRFSFKGSGEYDMVQFLHTAIAGRTFPAEPPRGKGQRVSPADDETVKDLGAVTLSIPAALTAARKTYRLLQY